jgi:hypothetical protein
VSSDNYTVLDAVVNKGVSLEVRLGLELIHSDRLFGDLLDSFYILNFMVRKADVSAESSINELLHFFPGGSGGNLLDLALF